MVSKKNNLMEDKGKHKAHLSRTIKGTFHQ